MNEIEAKTALANALTGIESFPLKLFNAISKDRKIPNNQLFIEFIILDFHAALEMRINDILTAYVSQNKLKSKKEVEKYFVDDRFSQKLKWIKRCCILDIVDKNEQKIFTIIDEFNRVRNSIAHRDYHVKGNCTYNNKDVFDEKVFKKLIYDVTECMDYLGNKYKLLLKAIGAQILFAKEI